MGSNHLFRISGVSCGKVGMFYLLILHPCHLHKDGKKYFPISLSLRNFNTAALKRKHFSLRSIFYQSDNWNFSIKEKDILFIKPYQTHL